MTTPRPMNVSQITEFMSFIMVDVIQTIRPGVAEKLRERGLHRESTEYLASWAKEWINIGCDDDGISELLYKMQVDILENETRAPVNSEDGTCVRFSLLDLGRDDEVLSDKEMSEIYENSKRHHASVRCKIRAVGIPWEI